MIEMISDSERDMFAQYVDAYALPDGVTRSVGPVALLKPWEENKSVYLNRIFLDNLILEKKISFSIPVDELEDQVDKKLLGGDWPCTGEHAFVAAYRDEVVRLCGNHINDGDKYFQEDSIFNYNSYYGLRRLISARCLALNTWYGDSFEVYNPEDENKPIKVAHGARIIRALNKIAKAYHLDDFEDFRLKHSQILNQKALTGTMCLSIHPLDYATMSDNDYGWSSCMSWKEEGCYRQGTVEMMNSSMVVVAYLRGDVDMNMPGANYWSNKKWRELFIVTPQIITNIKGYPYRNDEFTKIILNWLKELAEKAKIGTYRDDITEYNTWKDFYLDEKYDFTTRVETSTVNMYNDFADGQFGIFSNDEDDVNHTIELYYSGPSECMACGETNVEFDTEGCLCGECCVNYWYCDCCECRYTDSENMHWINDAYLCDYCYEENTGYDAITEEIYMNDDLTELSLGDSEKYDHTASIMVYFDRYRSKSFYTKYFKNIRSRYHHYGTSYYVDIDDCTKEGLALFGYESKEDVINDYVEIENFSYDENCMFEEVNSYNEIFSSYRVADRLGVYDRDNIYLYCTMSLEKNSDSGSMNGNLIFS